MKINVTVDLSDFYSEDDESTFSQQIKHEIARQVKNEILKDWDNKIKEEFSNAVKVEIVNQKEDFITSKIKELVVDAKVKKQYGGNEMISISDYITGELEKTYLSDRQVSNYLDNQIKKTTETISKQLKERYDMLFASQIVTKLHENKMLKDDVAKLLLNDNS